MSRTDASAGPVRVALLGATGRMGQSLVRAIHDSTEFELCGALASSSSPALGTDAGVVAGLARPLGVAVSADRGAALADCEVALDFSQPAAFEDNLAAALDAGAALLVGTTGLGAAAEAALGAAAGRIAVLRAPNTSLGVNLLARLVERAAAALPPEYDIEILEAHHRYKADAPSGTALMLAEAAALGRGGTRAALAPDPGGRRAGPRREGEIGFAVLRGGDLAGEHTVFFAGPGERVELTHRAHDRMTFAYGALRAAGWLRGRPPGAYSMADVLDLG
jgi:4-hydroxy-tetrahydrodipicolinate reductase